MNARLLVLLGCLAWSGAVTAGRPPLRGECHGFLEKQWSNGIHRIVGFSQTVAAVLPSSVAPPFFRILGLGLGPVRDEWRLEYNESVLESHVRHMEYFDLIPSAKRQKHMVWQARRFLERHHPDLARDPEIQYVLLDHFKMLLFVGTEELPREIPPASLVVLHGVEPLGYLRPAGNDVYSDWTPLTP